MDAATGHDVFINFTPANFHQNVPNRRASRTSIAETQQDEAEESDRSPDQQENRVPVVTHEDLAKFETVKRVLDVLKEGGMDVAGFLDALCWGNQPAIADPTTRSARTNLTHSDRLAGIVSRWLHPPRTSQGGSVAEGARQLLLPLIIKTVRKVINKEMDAVVEELKDESDITEESVLGTVIDKIQEKVRVTAPVFYDLVKTAAWSKKQDERNTLKEPTKRVSFIVCQAAFSRNHLANKMHRPISLYLKACGTAVKAFDTMSAPVPAITVASSPRASASARSICQSYGVIVGQRAVTELESVRRIL